MSSLQAPAGLQPSASYSFTMRIELRQLPGAFAQVAAAIGTEGAILGAIDLVRVDRGGVVRDVTVACTPGVGRVSSAIHEDPESAWTLTIKGNTVAVVSDGTAVLGLGDIGPE